MSYPADLLGRAPIMRPLERQQADGCTGVLPSAARPRDDYEKHLPYFEDKLGHLTPRQIERHHVIRWLDAWAKHKSVHFADYRLRVLSIVMEHAKDMGLLTKSEENPAKGIKALKYEKKEREPWPDTMVAAFRKAYANGTRERTLFEMCLGTGQRIGDVLRMQWGHVRGDTILVIQGKTGTRLEIPLTMHLSEALERPRSAKASSS